MTVCVVVPAYNAASYVVEALDSVARQSTLPDELVVVNDGSHDNTSQVVMNWIIANPSCKTRLIDQANGGIPVARNVGIRASSGDWIALLDADDVWETDHLAALLAALAAAPGTVAAYGAGRLLVNGTVQPHLYDDFWDNPSRQFGRPIAGSSYLRVDRAAVARLIHGNFIKPSSLCFARAATHWVGLFDEELRVSEDREFLIRLLLSGDFVYTSVPITQYRWHDDNASNQRNNRRNMEYALRALRCIGNNSAADFDAPQRRAFRVETGTAIRNYLYTCARDGRPHYAAGLQLVSQLYGMPRMLMEVNLKHLIRCLLPRIDRA